MANRNSKRFQEFRDARQQPRFPVPQQATDIREPRPFIGSGQPDQIPYTWSRPGMGYTGAETEEGSDYVDQSDIPDPEFIDPDDYEYFKNWKENMSGAYETSYDVATDEIWKMQDEFGVDPALALGGTYGGGDYTLGGSRYGKALDFGLDVNDPYQRYAAKHGYNQDLFDMKTELEKLDMDWEGLDMDWMESLGLDELLRMILGESMGGE